MSVNLKTFSTVNFNVVKEEKYSHKKYDMEDVYYITNTINDGTTFVTEDNITELISLLEYIKSSI